MSEESKLENALLLINAYRDAIEDYREVIESYKQIVNEILEENKKLRSYLNNPPPIQLKKENKWT